VLLDYVGEDAQIAPSVLGRMHARSREDAQIARSVLGPMHA
jgi:hypothetical protein